MEGIIASIVVVALIGLVALTIRSGRQHHLNWEKVGDGFGVPYVIESKFGPFESRFAPPTHMSFRLERVFVEVSIVTERDLADTDRRIKWTRFDLRFQSDGPQVYMTRQRAASRVATKLRIRKDAKVGNSRFDDRVVVNAIESPKLRTYLTPARQNVVLSLMRSYENVSVSNTTIRCEQKGIVTEPAKLGYNVRRLVDAAHVMGPQDDPPSDD